VAAFRVNRRAPGPRFAAASEVNTMPSTELGACEGFVWELRRSNLIDRAQLDQVVGEFLRAHPDAEPPALAEHLVRQQTLTELQADLLLRGRADEVVVGQYTLVSALGSGSMGTVYEAHSRTDGGRYAVKVLPRRSMWNMRIARRKVRAFGQCQHPAVVPFVDVGTCGAMHYLAWPMVEGETLDRVVQRQGKLGAREAARYAVLTAEGLDACHCQGLFHGLLKPSNIMIDPEGGVRILDFGIGSLLAEPEGDSVVDTASTANAVSSGLDCASPESVIDPTNLTPAGDQYSLGCTLYYCLTGQYPFPDGTTVEKMMAHQTSQPKPIKELSPDVPDRLVAVVGRLMQKDPAARYPATVDVVQALKPFAAGVSMASGSRAVSRGPARSEGQATTAPRADSRLPGREALNGRPADLPSCGTVAEQPRRRSAALTLCAVAAGAAAAGVVAWAIASFYHLL
jgi:serine/threonine-protein kinase